MREWPLTFTATTRIRSASEWSVIVSTGRLRHTHRVERVFDALPERRATAVRFWPPIDRHGLPRRAHQRGQLRLAQPALRDASRESCVS